MRRFQLLSVRAHAIAAMSLLFLAFPAPGAGFKRCNNLSEEELRKQLLGAPEYGFDQAAATFVYDAINKAKGDNTVPQPGPDVGYRFYAQFAQNNNNSSILALPWRPGLENQIGKEQADRMQVLSVNLRRFMRESTTPNDERINPEKILQAMETPPVLEWKTPEAVPTLVQMLQVESTPVRNLMVRLLARIKGKEASVALAQRAVFDLSAEVREKAAAALKDRPHEEFKDVLLWALRSPWPAAADHAAETMVAAAIKDLVPPLVHLLKEPDPRLPYTGPAKLQMVQEMVRLNHMTNCCLCHALSSSKEDRVRGRVPTPGQELAPAYYEAQEGLFVRADTTFLRQEFSVVQPVANQGKWPGHQRFDYFIRVRPATEREINAGLRDKDKAYPQRAAVLFALRELTGRDLGDTAEKWLTLLSPADQKLPLEKIIEKKETETTLTAPMTDIHSGKATNALLEIVRKNSDKGIKFQAVTLSEDTLKRINVVRKAGNLGLVRDNGKFTWPGAFTGAVKDVSLLNADERKVVESLTRNLVAAAFQDKPLDAKDLTKLRKQLEAARNRMAFRANLPQSDKDAALRFLDSFNEACVALEGKEGPVYAQYRKFIAGGKTVQELAEYLASNGLRLAPGMPDDEAAYRTLHAAIADFKVANASPSGQ